jgi:hypothetical protein
VAHADDRTVCAGQNPVRSFSKIWLLSTDVQDAIHFSLRARHMQAAAKNRGRPHRVLGDMHSGENTAARASVPVKDTRRAVEASLLSWPPASPRCCCCWLCCRSSRGSLRAVPLSAAAAVAGSASGSMISTEPRPAAVHNPSDIRLAKRQCQTHIYTAGELTSRTTVCTLQLDTHEQLDDATKQTVLTSASGAWPAVAAENDAAKSAASALPTWR